MVVRLCRVEADPACGWSPHNFKHFPFAGMTKEHTLPPNPARYLPGYDAERIREIETGTARAPGIRRERTPSKSEYLRGVCRRRCRQDVPRSADVHRESQGGQLLARADPSHDHV